MDMKIQQFKEFPDAINALREKTADTVIIEIDLKEEDGIFFECYVILRNTQSLYKLPTDYCRITDISGFRTYKVFKRAEEVENDLR
jgi:hypothetical protein